MYPDHMSGWGWFAGSLVMTLWLILIGLVVYIAVRLAQDHRGNR